MRQLPNDKYTVAWFKLAEFISRGEKERALGLYRLLIHSFDNKALAFQLEGDIFLSFNDHTAAIERYTKAGQLYHKEKRFIEATAIFEHIIMLKPDKYALQKLIDYYEESANIERLIIIFGKLCELLIKRDEYNELMVKLEYFDNILGIHNLMSIYHSTIISLCGESEMSLEKIEPLLKKVLENQNQEFLENTSHFIQKLKALHEDAYLLACEYIKKD